MRSSIESVVYNITWLYRTVTHTSDPWVHETPGTGGRETFQRPPTDPTRKLDAKYIHSNFYFSHSKIVNAMQWDIKLSSQYRPSKLAIADNYYHIFDTAYSLTRLQVDPGARPLDRLSVTKLVAGGRRAGLLPGELYITAGPGWTRQQTRQKLRTSLYKRWFFSTAITNLSTWSPLIINRFVILI